MGDQETARKPDFAGWATKNDLRCSDGRTIRAGAFEHMDKVTVPLVWMHQHKDAENVLGHAVLENRAFGVYTYGFFNDSERGQHMRHAVENGDIVSMSIYANELTEKVTRSGRDVLHGQIKEVSLVLAGANPGAFIEKVSFRHGADGADELDEAKIYTGLALFHGDDIDWEVDMGKTAEELEADKQEALEHAELSAETIKEVWETYTDDQKAVALFMIGDAAERAKAEAGTAGAAGDDAKHDDLTKQGEYLAHLQTTLTEGFEHMNTNLFERQGEVIETAGKLSHDGFKALMGEAKKSSFKEAVLAHADEYGINDIELLFPDAKAIGAPEVYSRRMGWVPKLLGGTKHTPFAKVKSVVFDITEEDARARGYIKGNQKKDEVVNLMKRTTGPATIYKKQKLDRDDLIDIDITDINVVAWLKAEIRTMLEEEIARAILFGDGRSAGSEDKVKDPAGANSGDGIRSIVNDADFYAIKADLPANVSPKDAVKGIIRQRSKWRGTGKPTLWISDAFLTDIMLEEDKFGRSLYETEQALADKLRVQEIVTVDIIDDLENLFAILVNPADYSIGTNKGGELTSFEDFDIDFNQHKYLMETRLSGALTKPFSAIVIRRAVGTLAVATNPSYNGTTDVITIPTAAGVYYTINDVVKTGAQPAITVPTEVVAHAAEGYYLGWGTTKEWTYTP